MRQLLSLCLLFCTCSFLSAQGLTHAPSKGKQRVSIDADHIKQLAYTAPLEESVADYQQGPLIYLPTEMGREQPFHVLKSPIMSADFQQAYPDLQTYAIVHARDSRISGRMMTTPDMIHVVLLDGKHISLIQPENWQSPKDYSMGTFDDPAALQDPAHGCNLAIDRYAPVLPSSRSTGFTNATRRTYNLAIVTTGEFHDANGGSVAAATAVVTASVNGIQAIYDRELSVRFNLLTPFIYTDFNTDPFVSSAARFDDAADAVAMNFASGTYDIGHVFHDSDQAPGVLGSGGVAYIGAVCRSTLVGSGSPIKGGGWSSSSDNTTASWYRLAAHEFGHMFGANHTFNGSGSSCSTTNISSNDAFEIGSGTTIMSYRGICDPAQNIPSFGTNDDYFHANSLEEMLGYIGAFGTCATTTNTGNNAPVVNANPTGMTYTIPGQTPFMLTGSATDVDGDALTYTWEQMDEDGAGVIPTQGFLGGTAALSAIAPLFRSYPPKSSPSRVFPEISNIQAGNNTGLTFEALPAASRTMNFALTVRDNNPNGGGVNCAATSVTVDATTGPFVVTSQNAVSNWISNGANTATITWDVAGTTGGGVNAATVDILFSVDGGNTFPYTLAAATTNDGTHTITIPNYPTYFGRIKVQGTDNIFFDINNADIVVSSNCAAEGSSITPETAVTEVEGDAALNLSLAPTYGTTLTTFAGTIDTGDPASNLAVENSAGGCISFLGNTTVYETHSFWVSELDNYTFSLAGAFGLVANIYVGDYDPVNPCTNWLASTGVFTSGSGTTLFGGVILALGPGTKYTMVISNFSSALPTLPAAYTVTTSAAGTGSTYSASPNPGGSYSYTYVMVDEGTGNIVAIDPNSDLSNAGTYPAGNYRVYGISYLSSANLAPYVGGAYSALENDAIFLGICGNMSLNSVAVTITSSSLPVEWLSFDATATESQQVDLSWITASETNNDYFAIERKSATGEFIEIGQVQGVGESQEPQAYRFFDATPDSDRLWYRLRQVDLDGKVSYSGIREVRLNRFRTAYQLFPNPATSEVTLLPPTHLEGQQHRIQLFDLQGKLLLTSEIAPTESQAKLNLNQLSPALYMVRVVSEKGHSSVLKLTVQ